MNFFFVISVFCLVFWCFCVCCVVWELNCFFVGLHLCQTFNFKTSLLLGYFKIKEERILMLSVTQYYQYRVGAWRNDAAVLCIFSCNDQLNNNLLIQEVSQWTNRNFDIMFFDHHDFLSFFFSKSLNWAWFRGYRGPAKRKTWSLNPLLVQI